ncbi:uncharacterized protein LOC126885227 [Diabrotica virgifera virgifera]|uniref:Uncharacterized protein LOC114336619 n=1 Tax=Diabrotica virgifera virgifera TaxID=50390 RepID=A0A6P7G1P0_DIAVI|nr:uncharacterized protein LOC126884732 [Diabrotica virgifera virgifera]XP_050507648.1 uncharacterized protein LOC126885227 [Diabrotica virgifera virgifera]
MASTSGARAELRAVLSENSSLNVNFIDDRDDSVADKDYKPSGDDFPSQSSEDELQEPIPRLFKDKEVNPEKKKPTRWRQLNEEHYDRNERKSYSILLRKPRRLLVHVKLAKKIPFYGKADLQ